MVDRTVSMALINHQRMYAEFSFLHLLPLLEAQLTRKSEMMSDLVFIFLIEI